jgi:putative peptidoglycan lipid II flippase
VTAGYVRAFHGSVNRRILGAALIVGVLTMAAKAAAMVKEVLCASAFGTGDALDAFYIAFVLPSFVVNVISTSAGAAVIPVYVEVLEKDCERSAQRLFAGVLTWSILLLVGLTGALALLGPYLLPVLASGFSPEKLELTTRLFYLLLPSVGISGLAALWGAVLNGHERFALVAAAAMLTPAGIIVALLALTSVWGVYALAFGTVVGFLGQALVLAVGLVARRLNPVPRWHGLEPPMRRVIKQYVPMMAAGSIMSSTVLVDQAMAAMLAPGSVAVLNYGNKLVAFALGISTTALGTAVIPYFSRMVAASDWAAVRASLRTYGRLVFFASAALAACAYVFSDVIVRVLYRRGEFTEEDVLVVSQVQRMYLLQVPFYSLGILFVRLISSLQANHVLMWGTVISFIVNITLDYVFMRVMGVAGIALSTSVVYLLSCGFLALMLHKKMRERTRPEDACA